MKAKTFYVAHNGITPIKLCGETVMWYVQVKGAYIAPYEISPTQGEHDFNTCEGCQQTLANAKEGLTDRYLGRDNVAPFPFCCELHKNLVNVKEFNREDFDNVPDMTARKLIYTRQHILNHIENEDYYEEITDYIDYVIDSFGQMPENCGAPLYCDNYLLWTINGINEMEDVPQDKKDRLLKFIATYREPKHQKHVITDINILLQIYEKWIKIFPFEISFFAKLKSYYEHLLPIVKQGTDRQNKYSGKITCSFNTKESLIKSLISTTNYLVQQINAYRLYIAKQLPDTDTLQLQYICSERKIKIDEGYVNKSPSEEQRYRKILKQWLKDEQDFVAKIAPILANFPPQPNTHQQGNIDIEKVMAIYDFCVDTNVLSKEIISNVEFINAVNNADFKTIYVHSENLNSKSKCKYIIYILSKFLGAEWFLNTAHSINTEPTKCSGINVPSEWKSKANAIK